MPAKKGCTPWNKGKKTSKDVKLKISTALKGKGYGRASTPEAEENRKKKISDTMKRKKLGGYRKGSGRGKKGRYKGVWCDSSWELAWVIYNLEHNIIFERNWKKFEYIFEGKIKTYMPDFIIGNTYYEIKGYMTNQAKEKIKQFKYDLVVLQRKDLIDIFNYVENKYGKDYIQLYE